MTRMMSETLTARMLVGEKQLVRAVARMLGMTPSAYLRRVAVDSAMVHLEAEAADRRTQRPAEGGARS